MNFFARRSESDIKLKLRSNYRRSLAIIPQSRPLTPVSGSLPPALTVFLGERPLGSLPAVLLRAQRRLQRLQLALQRTRRHGDRVGQLLIARLRVQQSPVQLGRLRLKAVLPPGTRCGQTASGESDGVR